MPDFCRARLGLGALTLALTTIVALTVAPSSKAAAGTAAVVAQTTASPEAQTTSAPIPVSSTLQLPVTPHLGRLNAGQPTPFPLNTLGPLSVGTSLPFPAYGTPVPGVNKGTPAPDVPTQIGLQQAELIGFARSPQLAIARADVGVEAAAVRLERAGLLPNFSGSAGYTYAHEQAGGTESAALLASGLGSGAGARTTSNNASLGLSLTQLIFDGGRIAASVEAAERSETNAADTYRRDLQTVAFDVATAYYNYLAAERLTQVDLEIVREDEVQLSLVEAQVRAGTEARAQIATAQLPVAQAQLAVVKAQGAELSAEAAFANSLGIDANVLVQPIDDAPVFTNSQISSIPIPTYAVALKRAYALRPDYYGAADTVEQAKYSLKSAELGLFPTLSADAGANDATSNQRLGNFRNSQTIGVDLSIPIYDQGVTAANVLSAKETLNSDYANFQSTLLTIQLNVKQALTNLVSAREAFTETQQEYRTAVVNLQSTQAEYQAGVTTLPLLLDAQVSIDQALTDQVTAVYTLRQAEQTYLYDVGANYDTSADNGTLNLRPTPQPAAQGGRVASHGIRRAAAPRTTTATLQIR